MMKNMIYRKPIGKQDRFLIDTVHVRTRNVRRSRELLREAYFTMAEYDDVKKDDIAELSRCQTIRMTDGEVSPEKLRMRVYRAIVQGAIGITYDSMYDGGVTRDSKMGPLYRYIQEMNYRITQIGRTMMALQNVGVYCAQDVIEKDASYARVARPIVESEILAEQELPMGLAIGEFKDSEGNRYLLIQNTDDALKSVGAFSFKLKKNFRVYRVNPHDGKQIISKDSTDVQKILIMPGDADLLRYQDATEEACYIEYALRK